MPNLVPGTPEYKEAYEAEMKRLEAEAAKGEKKPGEAETTSAQDGKGKGGADDAKPDPVEELRKEIAERDKKFDGLAKSLRDTQRWGHENARMVKKLNAELAEERKARTKPPILDANPGLEQAIEHVAGPEKRDVPEGNTWLDTVTRALPDFNDRELLADDAFFAKVEAKRRELGEDWNDPILAIRELSVLRGSHLSEKASAAAVEQARKDFEAKAKKRPAMDIPDGSGTRATQEEKDQQKEAERVRTMPKAEFEKMRSKVLGM